MNEIVESLTGPARTALMGTIAKVHPSYGLGPIAELKAHGLINADDMITREGWEVRRILLDTIMDTAFPPADAVAQARDVLVRAAENWYLASTYRNQVGLYAAIGAYREALGR